MHHARSHRASSTELRGGRNGSRRTKKNAGAALASCRRHGQSSSRVHGVADFVKWATQVLITAKADAAATSGAIDWRRERRRRQSATHTSPPATTAKPVVPSPVSATTREEAGAAASAPREAARLITSQHNASRHDSGPGIQIGARARRAVPAGHGFRISATIGDVTGEDEQNDDEHHQRLREDAAPRARRTPELSDDETRKRRRGLAQDRGRRTFGSRQLERLQSAMSAFHFDDHGKRRAHGSGAAARSALKASRQRQRCIHQLGALGVLPQGEGRAGLIRSLGAQRQRADAYAAAAARAAPGGAGRPTPVALGSSVQEGLEAARRRRSRLASLRSCRRTRWHGWRQKRMTSCGWRHSRWRMCRRRRTPCQR